jgi:hypothetical protein
MNDIGEKIFLTRKEANENSMKKEVLKMKVKFAYLDVCRKQIEEHTNTLLDLRDKYEVVVDEEKVTKLIEALEYFKSALETTPIA